MKINDSVESEISKGCLDLQALSSKNRPMFSKMPFSGSVTVSSVWNLVRN